MVPFSFLYRFESFRKFKVPFAGHFILLTFTQVFKVPFNFFIAIAYRILRYQSLGIILVVVYVVASCNWSQLKPNCFNPIRKLSSCLAEILYMYSAPMMLVDSSTTSFWKQLNRSLPVEGHSHSKWWTFSAISSLQRKQFSSIFGLILCSKAGK